MTTAIKTIFMSRCLLSHIFVQSLCSYMLLAVSSTGNKDVNKYMCDMWRSVVAFFKCGC